MTEREFNRYIEQIRPRLLMFAGYFVGYRGASTAEDMVQDAVIKVWIEIKKSVTIRNMDALITAVLKNLCIDHLRLARNKAIKVEPTDRNVQLVAPTDPQNSLEIKERLEWVKEKIASLPLDQQMVLKLREVMGYEYSEIAIIMDISEGNARTLLSRGRKAILAL